jgi:hypothetical protein
LCEYIYIFGILYSCGCLLWKPVYN